MIKTYYKYSTYILVTSLLLAINVYGSSVNEQAQPVVRIMSSGDKYKLETKIDSFGMRIDFTCDGQDREGLRQNLDLIRGLQNLNPMPVQTASPMPIAAVTKQATPEANPVQQQTAAKPVKKVVKKVVSKPADVKANAEPKPAVKPVVASSPEVVSAEAKKKSSENAARIAGIMAKKSKKEVVKGSFLEELKEKQLREASAPKKSSLSVDTFRKAASPVNSLVTAKLQAQLNKRLGALKQEDALDADDGFAEEAQAIPAAPDVIAQQVAVLQNPGAPKSELLQSQLLTMLASHSELIADLKVTLDQSPAVESASKPLATANESVPIIVTQAPAVEATPKILEQAIVPDPKQAAPVTQLKEEMPQGPLADTDLTQTDVVEEGEAYVVIGGSTPQVIIAEAVK